MGDAAPRRRYDIPRDGQSSRDRSPSLYSRRTRSRSPPRWRSFAPHSPQRPPPDRARSPRRCRSRSRYRDRSQSPPPRGYLSARRSRSRSPRSNYSVEDATDRRIRLLAEKVMSMETFRRVRRDPHSPWSNSGASGTMPIPVPLNPGENAGDYKRKFEFWLAQRNVSLASLQKGDPNLERTYRFSYAQWRLVKVEGHPMPSSGGGTELPTQAWRRGRSRSMDSPQRDVYNDERQWKGGDNNHPIKEYVWHGNRADAPKQRTQDNRMFPSSYPDTGSQWASRRYDQATPDGVGRCCETCGRNWINLSRRVKQLEEIVARLELPSDMVSYSKPRDDTSPQSNASIVIDLTDDVEAAIDEVAISSEPSPTQQYHNTVKRKPNNEVEEKPAEISPYADGEDNHQHPLIASDPLLPSMQSPMSIMESLVDAYNQLNEKVMLNEKAEEDALALLESTVGEDQAAAVELRSQIYELRGSIKVEKDNRDAAAAAAIALGYEDRKDALSSEIDALATSCVTDDHQSLHEECAHIASKLAENNNELARLQKQLDTHLRSLNDAPEDMKDENNAPGNVENKELSSKIELEQASKASLKAERHKIFLRLIKSNRQIERLVKMKLKHA